MHQQGGLIDSTAGQKLEDLSGKLLVERFLFVAPGIAARLMNCQHLGGVKMVHVSVNAKGFMTRSPKYNKILLRSRMLGTASLSNDFR